MLSFFPLFCWLRDRDNASFLPFESVCLYCIKSRQRRRASWRLHLVFCVSFSVAECPSSFRLFILDLFSFAKWSFDLLRTGSSPALSNKSLDITQETRGREGTAKVLLSSSEEDKLACLSCLEERVIKSHTKWCTGTGALRGN